MKNIKSKLKTKQRICRKAVCVCLSACLSVLLVMIAQRAGLVMCHMMSQGVVASEEELRQTLLHPEEAEPQQEGVEHADEFNQPDLFGT